MHILNNLTAFVTGAGSGIGKAIAHRYAAEGANVFITDIREDRLLAVADEIKQAGGKVAFQAGDLADENAVQSLVDACRKQFGEIDILVNNAGILDNFMPAAEVSFDLWKRVMQVNVDGPFFTCHAVLPGMVERGRGIIQYFFHRGPAGFTRRSSLYHQQARLDWFDEEHRLSICHQRHPLQCHRTRRSEYRYHRWRATKSVWL